MCSRQFSSSLLLVFICFSMTFKVNANVHLDMDYSMKLEHHSDEEDRALSSLIFSIDNNYQSDRLNLDLDLSSDLIYEHKSKEDSSLMRGTVDADYKFNNAISWILDSELSEINRSTSTEFDELNSQTVTNTVTGFVYSLKQGFRGEFNTRLLTRIYTYEDTPLDAQVDSVEISYLYPLNDSSSITSRILLEEQEYDDQAQALNNVENTQFRLDYLKQFSRTTTQTFIEFNDVEYLKQDQENEIEAYGFNVSYQINSRSNISIDFSHDLQQSFLLNSNLAGHLNTVQRSGLVENDRYTMQYDLRTNISNFSIQVYQNNLKDVSALGTINGAQDSFFINYIHQLNEKIDLDLTYEEVKNEINNTDVESGTVSVNYKLSESSVYTTLLSLNVEERDENSNLDDDVEIVFEFRAAVF